MRHACTPISLWDQPCTFVIERWAPLPPLVVLEFVATCASRSDGARFENATPTRGCIDQ